MIGIVIVSYKNTRGTIDYVTNQLPRIKTPWKAVIVENSQDWDVCQKIAEGCNGKVLDVTSICQDDEHHVYVIAPSANIGFARGNNLGADFLLRNYNCDYLLFSNDDIILKDADVVESMIAIMEKNNDVAVVGPRVLGVDNKDQSPHYKIITPIRQIAWKLFPMLRRKRKVGNTSTDIASGYCYWVSGCFFLFKARDFQSVSGFDPDTFLYGEEVIMAERLMKLGKREYFLSSSQVVHLGGCSTKQIQNDKLRGFLKESNSLYYKKYLGYNDFVIWVYNKLC